MPTMSRRRIGHGTFEATCSGSPLQAFNDDISNYTIFLVPLMSEVLTDFDDLNGLLMPCSCPIPRRSYLA